MGKYGLFIVACALAKSGHHVGVASLEKQLLP